MRTEQEVMALILRVAHEDARIRGVMLGGSRANTLVSRDDYQDYDIAFAVTDMTPFYHNPAWVEEKFSKPLIMQMPETMRGAANDGNFFYLMIFPDGVRIDLSFIFEPYIDDGEPVAVLLDKDEGKGLFPPITVNPQYWAVKPPTALDFYSCCNNFWWCVNNIAKGIMRDELPYVMATINKWWRNELHDMMNWYIGTQHGFTVSTGTSNKYFKQFLSPKMYTRYAATYCGSNYEEIWEAVAVMCDLFSELAQGVAPHFSFTYRQEEEAGMRAYVAMMKAGALECKEAVNES